MKHILIIGAKSDIAMALAKEYAQNGYHLILAGRQIETLNDFSNLLISEYSISVELVSLDILNLETHSKFISNLKNPFYGVICCAGYLGNQELAENNLQEANLILQTNFTSCINILTICANELKKLNDGFIVGISSVAGDRGRQSNYYYGSAKAGFTAYLSGLRSQLVKNNIHVLTVKPGFVYTKMTAHLKLPKSLTTTPKVVATKVYRAQHRNKNIIYVKWFWKYIMLIIKLLPEFIFKKIKL